MSNWPDDIEQNQLKEQFADRQEFIENFRSKLHYREGQTLPILMHHGLTGRGKSWLVHHLMWEICPKAAFDAKDRGYPCAYVTFRDGDVVPTPANTLGELRRDLRRKFDVKCLRFDLLWSYYRSKIGKPVESASADLLPEEIGTIAELLELVTEFPVISPIFKVTKLFNKAGKYFADKKEQEVVLNWFREQKEIGDNWKDKLETMKTHRLEGLLPKAFAADLENAAHKLRDENIVSYSKQAAPIPHYPLADKIVLFLDTYEEVQKSERWDNWIRKFAKDLVECQRPVLLVISGQKPIRWSESDDWWETGIYKGADSVLRGPQLEIWEIRDLSEEDSYDYLYNKRNLRDKELISHIQRETRGHPLLLRVAAETNAPIEQSELPIVMPQDSEQWIKESLQELLQRWKSGKPTDLVQTARAIAILRWFDEHMLMEVFSNLLPSSLHDQYEEIRKTLVEPGTQVHRYHELMREAFLADMSVEERQRLHRLAYKYFKKQEAAAFPYLVEQVYHQFCLDEEKGYRLLEKHVAPRLQRYCLEEMEKLLRAVPDNLSPRVQLHKLRYEADLLHRSGRNLDEAERIYHQILNNSQTDDHLKLKTRNNLALLCESTNRLNDALDGYTQVLTDARRLADEERMVAIALLNLGNVWAKLKDFNTAFRYHQESVDYLEMLLAKASGGSISIQSYRKELHQILASHFDEEDLRTLCFYLTIEYDNLQAKGKINKARNLIEYVERRNDILKLVDECKQLRPNISWDAVIESVRKSLIGPLPQPQTVEDIELQSTYRVDISTAYNNLALDYLDRNMEGDVRKAIELLYKVLKLESENDNDEGRSNVYADLARAYLTTGDINLALINWIESLEIVEKINHEELKEWLAEKLEEIESLADKTMVDSIAKELLIEAKSKAQALNLGIRKNGG